MDTICCRHLQCSGLRIIGCLSAGVVGCVGEYLGQYRFVLDGARFRSEDQKGIRSIMMQVFDVLSGLASWLVSLMVISVSANFLYAAKALVSMGKARVDPTIRCEFIAFFIPLVIALVNAVSCALFLYLGHPTLVLLSSLFVNFGLYVTESAYATT
ncbi:hypothetical protein KW882_27495 [Vibrio parahaemolyticus]